MRGAVAPDSARPSAVGSLPLKEETGPPAPVPDAPESVHRRDSLIAYLFPVTVTMAATVMWFRPGRFVAAGDVSPLVRDNLATEWWSLWTHQLSGTGSTSYEAGRALEVVFPAVAHILGLSAVVAQWALFAACCALAAYGTAFFIRAWIANPWICAAVGLFGSFNAFQMVNLPDLLPAVAIGTAGLIGGLIVRSAAGRKVRAHTFALATLPLAYVSLNPPLLGVVIVWTALLTILATLLATEGGLRRAARLLLRGGTLAVALNAWWLVPFALGTIAPAGITFAAQTDVQAWAWSQARNSVPNVLTLNTHWGWTHPEYFPYATSVDSGPFGWARWVLPGMAGCGLVWPVRTHRRAAWTLTAVAMTLVFIAKGLHPPFSGANLWLYGHVPGMWLLREPMSKVGILLVLLEAVGAALALQRILTAPLPGMRLRVLVNAAIAAVLVAGLAHPWPLWTGAVVPSARGDLPGARVAVPGGWKSLAKAVNERTGPGAVLVLPLDPFYQVTTSWGYHGVDSIPEQLIDRPVLQELPGGYFSNQPAVTSLLGDVQAGLVAGDGASVRRRLQALGVSAVVLRHDLIRGPTDSAFADPHALEQGMKEVPGANLVARSGMGSVFGLAGAAQPIEAYTALLATSTKDPALISAAVASMPANVATTDDSRAAVDGLTWQVTDSTSRSSFVVKRTGTYQITYPATAETVYRPQVVHLRDGRWQVVLEDPSDIVLDGRRLEPRPAVNLPVTAARPVAVGADGLMHALGAGTTVRLRPGATVTVYGAATAQVPLGRPSGTGDCDRSRVTGADKLSAAVSATEVNLHALSGNACAWWNLPPGAGMIMVDATAHTIQGGAARLCLWSSREGRCQSSNPPSNGHWTGFGQEVSAQSLQLFAYADGLPGGTTTTYGRVSFEELRAETSDPVPLGSGPTQIIRLAAGVHHMTFSTFLPGQRLSSLSPLQDCNSTSPEMVDVGAATLVGDGVTLTARRDTACVSATLQSASLASRYRLSLDYRTIKGEPARLCVWEIGPARCANIPELPASGRPQHLDTYFEPDPGTRGLQVYLYADSGPGPDPTVTQYTRLRLVPADPFVVVIAPIATARFDAPKVASHCGPDACKVRVAGARGDFVLGTDQSWAKGWRLEGLPAGWRARHIELDGYANGWQVTGQGAANLVLAYGPDRYVRWAHWATAAALIVTIGMAARSRRRCAARQSRVK